MYDSTWNVLTNQTLYSGTTGPIYINSAVSGNYFILITSDSNEFHGNHYDLRIDLNGQQTQPMTDDWAEENDERSNSYMLTGPGNFDGLVCQDDDWFGLGPVFEQETLRIELQYDKVQSLSIELVDETGSPHGYFITDESWGKVLEWTAGFNNTNVYFRIGGDYGTWYNFSLFLGDNTNNTSADDWMEENDAISNAYDIEFDRHNGLTQLDLDWYRVWLEPNDQLEVFLYYDTALVGIWMDLDLYELDGAVENHLVAGTSNGGHESLGWTNGNQGQYVYIRVDGPNNGDWYDLEVKLNGGTVNPMDPSLDWVAFTVDDWAEWEASVEVFSETGNSTFYEGSLRGDINNVQLTDHSVAVDANMQWTNIPMEYLAGFVSGAYKFDIEGDGFAYPSYFGFASTFVGKGFHYADQQPIFTNLDGFTYQILDNGLTLEIESVASADMFMKMRVTYTEEGLLKEISMEGDFMDATGAKFAKGKIKLNLLDASFLDGTSTDNSTTDDTTSDGGDGDGENPFSGFDISSIPGFPLEIIGSVLGFSIIAMIVVVKKKSKKML